jgi:NADH:ubiquinone oxidoreductase subunit F (NADH-binding)
MSLRSHLLPLLHESEARDGFLSTASVTALAGRLRIPIAEAWEVATSYPDFSFAPPSSLEPVCMGLSCLLLGAALTSAQRAVGCRFRCFDAPAPGLEVPVPEEALRHRGPLLAPDVADWAGLDRARALGQTAALSAVEQSGLRGRGGAYFPVGRKWSAALSEGRPVALVINAEEGEPGVFKDRSLLCRRPRRFLEGLAIAAEVLRPALIVIFINGEAQAARASLDAALDSGARLFAVRPTVIPGGGGYVLGEESALLNAIEGRKPVPRTRPPFPVQSGLFGMPTVVNNVESIAHLSVLFREGVETFRSRGTAEAPGTKLMSVSGRLPRPGLYEVSLGSSLGDLVSLAGGPLSGEVIAVLAGGPSGGFLPPSEFDRPLLPGLMHPSGAVAGSGGMVVLDSTCDIRAAALAMARFNADESCGKCTPCREGVPRVHDALQAGELEGLSDLLEVVGAASLCQLGLMAPGPIRSALHFWPELFR